MQFSIYRYNPETDSKPYMKDYELKIPIDSAMMVLEALQLIKEQTDMSLTANGLRDWLATIFRPCFSDLFFSINGLFFITPGLKFFYVARVFCADMDANIHINCFVKFIHTCMGWNLDRGDRLRPPNFCAINCPSAGYLIIDYLFFLGRRNFIPICLKG